MAKMLLAAIIATAALMTVCPFRQLYCAVDEGEI